MNDVRRHFAAMAFFFVVAGVYNWSFCGCLGVDTVNIFSSVNYVMLTLLGVKVR